MQNWTAACGHRSAQVRSRQPEKTRVIFVRQSGCFIIFRPSAGKSMPATHPQHSRNIPATLPQHPTTERKHASWWLEAHRNCPERIFFFIKHLPNVENSKGSLRSTHRHGHASLRNVEKQQRRLQASHSLGDNFSLHGAR